MHKHIRLLAKGVNVETLVHEITRQPWLWNTHRDRTMGYGCPHSNISDIWARYRAIDDLTKPEHFAEEHDSVWYDAFYALPSIRKIVFDLMGAVQAERLGGVLITKVPPGEQVKPHVDSGWHSDYYDKYAVQLQSAPEQAFCFENEHLVTEPGDVYWFNNKYSHWVINNSKQDRMTMIVCIRSDRKGV